MGASEGRTRAVTAYRIEMRPRASKHLAHIDPVARQRLAKAVDALASDPEPPGCSPLKSIPGAMRVRVGDYRIVYVVLRDTQVIDVHDIDHRKDIYR